MISSYTKTAVYFRRGAKRVAGEQAVAKNTRTGQLHVTQTYNRRAFRLQ